MPQFFATCASSLEYLLVDELSKLGAENVKEGLSVVNFDAEWPVLYKILMWSRVASRIMYPIAEFEARDEQQLYDNASIIDWSQHIKSNGCFLVNSQSFRSELSHTKFVSQRVKDAIVDHFTENDESRPDVEFERPDVAIHCKIRHNKAILSIDFAGYGLHHRGYRGDGGAAPIKENLAAALLMRAGWLKSCLEASAGSKLALYDPMCGSGTFLIEALMMAKQIAPGYLRDYLGIFGWQQFNKQLWQEVVDDACDKAESDDNQLSLEVAGSDINPKAIKAAQVNLASAGLEHLAKLKIAGLDQIEQFDLPSSGLVIVNPPYSERLGEFEQVKSIYAQLGGLLKHKFMGWKASILCPNKDFGHALGIRAKKIYKFNNGSIACELLNVEVDAANFLSVQNTSEYDPEYKSKLSDAGIQFVNRLVKNRTKLKKYLSKNQITCYRIYDADLPEYNAAIDVYHENIHVQEYRAPKSIDSKVANRRLKEIQRAVAGVFEIPLDQVYVKQRRQQKGDWQYESKGRDESGQLVEKRFFEVIEAGRKFRINLEDYLDTGLFIDHRRTRELVAELGFRKRVLNLFCYTGSVSVYTATAGASETVNVDMSNTYLNWAKENFKLNKVDINKHQFVRDDSIKWLQEAVQTNERFDLIFLDPPTFSNSKKMEQHFDVQSDHVSLIQSCLNLLSPKGVLIFSNNFHQFNMEFNSSERCKVTEITKQTTSQDYLRKPLHRSWKIELI